MKVTVVVMMNFTCIACAQINIKEGFVCSAMNNAKLTNLHIKGKMDGPFLPILPKILFSHCASRGKCKIAQTIKGEGNGFLLFVK